ncbi:MAG: hypothetical protein ABIC18_04485 [Candidatus Omnitrophota bacterium]
MFNLKDLGDMTKLAGQAKEIQKQQEQKQQEQINVLTRIANTLEQILAELKTKK